MVFFATILAESATTVDPEEASILEEALSMVWEKESAVFAVAVFFLALLIWILDCIQVKVLGNNSLLKVAYTGAWSAIQVTLFWSLGAALAAYVGSLIDLFATSKTSMVVVGIGWPAVLPRLIQMAEESPEDEQPVDDEI